jgi:hypothetical protein
MMAQAPIPPSRLLQNVEDALIVIGPDLVIRDVANVSAQALSPLNAAGQSLVGLTIADAVSPLFAPFERPGFVARLRAALDPVEADAVQHTIEGAAPVAVRAAGLTPYYDVTVRRYVDDSGVLLSVSIRDVSDRLQLRRALALVREERDLAIAVLRSEPSALYDYLRTALETLTLVQSLQRLPARTTEAFRSKLRRIAAELQQVGQGAAALGIDAIAQSTREILDALERTADKDLPSGEDFLPLAAALDTVFRQLVAASLDMELREASHHQMQSERLLPSATSDAAWPAALSVQLVERIEQAAAECGCRATLTISGLDVLPSAYHRGLAPLLLQLVDNAASKGIEPAGEREAAAKPLIGHVGIACTAMPQGGYELLISDDGRGLNVSDIPFLQDLVMRLGGTIGVSTSKGRYTRLRIQLPAEPADATPGG